MTKNDVYEKITNLCKDLNPSKSAIEDIFLFMGGKSKNMSSAKTIVTLAVFNRTASLACYHNSSNIKFYSVHEIRKIIKSSYSDIKSKIAKEEMPDIIIKYLEPSFNKIINRKGNIAKETFDEADGIAVAWACALQEVK